MAENKLEFNPNNVTKEQRHILQSFVDKNPHIKQHVIKLFKEEDPNPYKLHNLKYPRGFTHMAQQADCLDIPAARSPSFASDFKENAQTPMFANSVQTTAEPFILQGSKFHVTNNCRLPHENVGHSKLSRSTKRNYLPALKLTEYVNSDFGFHNERLDETVGMSLQKNIRHERELVTNMREIARKHIYALQTPSLNYRGCRTAEGLSNLKITLASGNVVKSGTRIMSNGERFGDKDPETSINNNSNNTPQKISVVKKVQKESPPAVDHAKLRVDVKGH